jgi:hypothetical protein
MINWKMTPGERMRVLLSALVFFAAFAGLSQALPAAKQVATKTVPAKKAPLSDQQLEAAIRQKFGKSKIAVNGFEVKVHSGKAVITGRTSVIQHKGTATRLAKTAGARAVDNRVEVDAAARAKAGSNLHQARRTAKVKRSEPRTER